jgi:hypothetical protein
MARCGKHGSATWHVHPTLAEIQHTNMHCGIRVARYVATLYVTVDHRNPMQVRDGLQNLTHDPPFGSHAPRLPGNVHNNLFHTSLACSPSRWIGAFRNTRKTCIQCEHRDVTLASPPTCNDIWHQALARETWAPHRAHGLQLLKIRQSETWAPPLEV